MIDTLTYGNGSKRTALIVRTPENARARRYVITLSWHGRIRTETRRQFESNLIGARQVARAWVKG